MQRPYSASAIARAKRARADVIYAVSHDWAGFIVDFHATWACETLCEAVSGVEVGRSRRVGPAAFAVLEVAPEIGRSLQAFVTM
mgnify:CR=1 FL=1